MKSSVPDKIEQLKKIGYEVSIDHMRHYEFAGAPISPRGGLTWARIWKGAELISFGSARCSREDNYNKKVGANIALGRAMKHLKNLTHDHQLDSPIVYKWDFQGSGSTSQSGTLSWNPDKKVWEYNLD